MSQPVELRKDEYTSYWHKVPGWAISLGLHGALLLVFMSTMRGCGGTTTGRAGEEFRNFGIYVTDSAPNDADTPTTEVETTDQNSTEVVDANPVDAQPPADLSLPNSQLPAIGAGPPQMPPSVGASDIKQVVKSSGQLQADSLGLGPGETAFVDIRDSGTTFVYVIDQSGSMLGNKIAFARAQLSSSLNVLQPYQQFGVLFYNTRVTSLQLRAGDGTRMYAANERNVARAIREIRAVRTDDGTKHYPALKKAIELRPDVIFFLTDGHDTPITPGDRETIRRLNRGRSRIHCIEFGEGGLTSPNSWLRAVARENGGRYKYVDVTRLP